MPPTRPTLIARSESCSGRFCFKALSLQMSALTSEFTRSFFPAVLARPAWSIPSNHRQITSGDCLLPHVISRNVRLTQAVVGERSGECKLYVSDKLNVDHRAYKADGDSRRAIPIQMVALDDYFKPGQRVDLIKMDIQGYELHALRGAQRVLQENPGINLLLEFWPAGLAQAGVGWEEACRDASAFKYESHCGANLWFGSVRCARRSKRYFLVCECFRPSYPRLDAELAGAM